MTNEIGFYTTKADIRQLHKYKRSKNIKTLGIPACFARGSHKAHGALHDFIVISRFGADLEHFFEEKTNLIPEHTIYRLAIFMLDDYEYIHHCNYIYGDLKASHILLGCEPYDTDKVYLVDFVSSKQISHPGTKSDSQTDNGTLIYKSRDAHEGLNTFRGDLETLGYNILHWKGISTPWFQRSMNVLPYKKAFMNNLENYLTKNSLKNRTIFNYFNYVKSLKTFERPDYQKCKRFFIDGLSEMGKSNQGKFELNHPFVNNVEIQPIFNLPEFNQRFGFNQKRSMEHFGDSPFSSKVPRMDAESAQNGEIEIRICPTVNSEVNLTKIPSIESVCPNENESDEGFQARNSPEKYFNFHLIDPPTWTEPNTKKCYAPWYDLPKRSETEDKSPVQWLDAQNDSNKDDSTVQSYFGFSAENVDQTTREEVFVFSSVSKHNGSKNEISPEEQYQSIKHSLQSCEEGLSGISFFPTNDDRENENETSTKQDEEISTQVESPPARLSLISFFPNYNGSENETSFEDDTDTISAVESVEITSDEGCDCRNLKLEDLPEDSLQPNDLKQTKMSSMIIRIPPPPPSPETNNSSESINALTIADNLSSQLDNLKIPKSSDSD